MFAPAGPVVPQALLALDGGGTVALAGIHMSPIPQLDYQLHLFRERDIHPVTANTREDGRELLAESAAAGVKPHTMQYPLADANRAAARSERGAHRWHGRVDDRIVMRERRLWILDPRPYGDFCRTMRRTRRIPARPTLGPKA